MAVYVVGNACIDWSFRVPRLPQAGETLNASRLSFDLGGKGALQAIAASRTGAAVRFSAAVGDDPDGAQVRALLCQAGLPDAELALVDAATDRSVIFVDETGENLIVSAADAARIFFPPSGWMDAATDSDLLLVQNNLSARTTAVVLQQARRRGLFTVWNVSPVDDAAADLSLAALAIVNYGEGNALTDAGDADGILAALRARGVRAAIVTLGADGAAVLPAGARSATFVPAPRVDATDTSGAGDVFCGMVVGLLDRGLDLLTAARAATAVAGLAVTRHGTMRSVPTAAEVEAAIVASV